MEQRICSSIADGLSTARTLLAGRTVEEETEDQVIELAVDNSEERAVLDRLIGRLERIEWQKLRERNEALDCRVYARAAAWIVGADRWSEARWVDLEAQVAADGKDDGGQDRNGEAGFIRPVRRQVQRRSVRSSYMG